MNAPLKSSYKRSGHRISLLGVARYCSAAPELSEKHGASRPALMSKVFHARAANDASWKEGWARLSAKEREELDQWKAPSTIITLEGDERIELDYASAEKEVLLGITEHGGYADPTKRDVFLRGYMDFGWIRMVGSAKVAYVCDIKKSEWTTSDGPDDPQVAAYGFAYADLHGCDAFVPAIWAATEGTWEWGSYIDLASSQAADLWATVKAAGTRRKGEFITGQHCRNCFARLHCPEYVLPASVADTRLAGLESGEALTADKARECLLHAQALKDVADAAIKTIQEAARRGLEITDPRTGKRYKAITCTGREGVSVETLRKELGGKAEQYIKRGQPYQMFKWVKA